MKDAVTPRLEMTRFRGVEVQRQIENYTHNFNYTLQQNKQQKGCVLETQPVSGFLSAVGLCSTVLVLSNILSSTGPACCGKSKSFSRFHRKNVSPLPFT